MATTNRERVGAAMDLLQSGIRPYIVREMKAVYKGAWLQEMGYALNTTFASEETLHLDTQALLKLIWFR